MPPTLPCSLTCIFGSVLCGIHKIDCSESPWGTPAFIKQLRAGLDSAGFRATKLVLMDGGLPAEGDPFWPALRTDAAFRDAFAAVGYHYPCVGKGRAPAMREYRALAGSGCVGCESLSFFAAVLTEVSRRVYTWCCREC